MMSDQWRQYSARLEFHSTSVELEKMNELLGEPRMAFERAHTEGICTSWHLPSDVGENEPLMAHIEQLLNIVEPLAERVHTLLHNEGTIGRIFCAMRSYGVVPHASLGEEFTVSLLERAANLDLEMRFEIYDLERLLAKQRHQSQRLLFAHSSITRFPTTTAGR